MGKVRAGAGGAWSRRGWFGVAAIVGFAAAGCGSLPGATSGDAVLSGDGPARQQVRHLLATADATPASATAAPAERAATGESSPADPPQASSGAQLTRPIYAQIGTIDYPDPPPMYPRFSFTGEYLYGDVNGKVQIPSGGKNGTTNGNRPRLSEIGISTASIGDGEISARLDENQELFFGAQFIRLSGNGVIHPALTSHGVHFPAGTAVSSDLQFDWYRVGYRYAIVLHTADNEVPDVTLTPWIEGIVWDFGYSLGDGKKLSATRSFAKPGVQIGGEIAWRPEGGPLTLAAGAGSFPQINSVADISVEYLVARYHFYRWHQFDFTGSLGVALEQQAFKDSQKLPNNISVNFEPMLIVGGQISF